MPDETTPPPLPGSTPATFPIPAPPHTTQFGPRLAVPSWWANQSQVLEAIWAEYRTNGYESAEKILKFARAVLTAMREREQ